MKAELTDISACRKTFDIEVPQDVVDHEITHIAQEYMKRARVPGFRPGKAPIAVVKTRYREEILSEMVQHLLPRYFSTAVKEKALDPVDAPEYDAIEYDNGKPLKFKANFEVYPELSISNYKGIPTTPATVEVADAEVDSTIKKLQEDMSELTPVEEERAANAGDFGDISFSGTAEGDEQPLFTDKATVELGVEITQKEFTENLVGAAVNEEKQ